MPTRTTYPTMSSSKSVLRFTTPKRRKIFHFATSVKSVKSIFVLESAATAVDDGFSYCLRMESLLLANQQQNLRIQRAFPDRTNVAWQEAILHRIEKQP